MLESWNAPLILVDFVHNQHFNLTAKRSSEPRFRNFHRMVDMVKASPESSYAGPNLILSLLSLLDVANDFEQSKECMSNGHTGMCMEPKEHGDHTDDDETQPSRKILNLRTSSHSRIERITQTTFLQIRPPRTKRSQISLRTRQDYLKKYPNSPMRSNRSESPSILLDHRDP